ncbi:MAG TPA: cytidylate kinase-like family protein [Ornithinibacter sp.]|nr:cytidylate kinase-like family protein [Ornithinibacter sp.]HQD69093.1 cytidylate kinase-like family protein [Ornithinibacter sp.]
MAVVTISRQLGSYGGKVGRGVAKALGYAYADSDVIEKVFRTYGLTRLSHLYSKPPRLWELFNYDSLLTVSMLNETIQALAKRGNVVIVGRGGFAVLKGLADVVNVRVTAGADTRAARVSERDAVDAATAASRVAADDEARARFVSLFYGADSSDPSAFDVTLSTDAATSADAVAEIVNAVLALEKTPAGTTAAALEVDPVLAAAVADALP